METDVTNAKEKYDLKYIVSTVMGIILFYMIGKYGKIPTGEKDIFVYLQYVILVYLAGRFGPLCGGIVGFVGHLMIDKTSEGQVWYSWIIGSAVLGILIGFISKKMKIDLSKPEKKDRRIFAVINISCQLLVWYLVAPVLNIVIYQMNPQQAFEMGFVAGVNNIVTSVILCDLFMFTFDHIIVRKIVSLIIVVNSLVLLSYGNYGFGSIGLYTYTIIMSTYVFLHSRLNPMTKTGVGKIVKIVFSAIGLLFLISFLFLHIIAVINKPTGDEKCMIVLGAGLNGEKPSTILQYRLDKAYEYIENHPNIIVITSGGQGSDEIIAEGNAMRNYLIDKGCNPDKIIAECSSSTTEENFAYSIELMKEYGMDENTCTIVVTNDFHCFRSIGQAKESGLTDVHPLASRTPAIHILTSYFREVFSIGKYFIKNFI